MFTTSIATPISVANTLYVSLAGNDATAARGRLDKPFASPTAAANAAQSGDVILVGPGVFDITSLQQGTNVAGTLRLPAGVSLIGSGNPAIAGSVTPATGFGTVIKSTAGTVANTSPATGRGVVLNPQGSNYIANLYIQATATQVAAIGAHLDNGDTFGANVILNNVGFGTVWHGIQIQNLTSASTGLSGTWAATNCVGTGWDDTVLTANTGSTPTWNFTLNSYGCNFTALTNAGSTLAPTVYSPRTAGATFNDFGSVLTGTGPTGALASNIAAVSAQNGAIVNLSGTAIVLNGPTLTSGSIPFNMSSSAVINIGPGVSYDATRLSNIAGFQPHPTGPWQPPKQYLAESAGLVATNAALGSFFILNMTGNDTLSNPTGMYDGQKITWRITTNSNTLTFDTAFTFGTPGAPTLTSGTNYLVAQYNKTSGNWEVLGATTGF